MTRARAEALVLVNWKGVFYERYLLDVHTVFSEGSVGLSSCGYLHNKQYDESEPAP